MSKICPCPNPPGGHIVCEDNQFGMCGYRDGRRIGGCLNPPSAVTRLTNADERNLAMANWVLTALTGVQRARAETIWQEEISLLYAGEYVTPTGGVIRFNLPSDLDLGDLRGRALVR